MNTQLNESTMSDYTNWNLIKFSQLEEHVVKLQQRIYQAEIEGKHRKVRELQRTLLRSKANLLISIEKVTQYYNCGRQLNENYYLSSKNKLKLYKKLLNEKIDDYTPKECSIKDRVYQNMVKTALEPQWEAKFEPTVYGYRPGRTNLDAVERVFVSLNPGKKQYIFVIDFNNSFDYVNSNFILEKIKNFPLSKLVFRWLEAGLISDNPFDKTKVLSPLLCNILLDGLEEALKIKYQRKSRGIKNNTHTYVYQNETTYNVSRYADKIVIMCKTKEEVNNIPNLLAPYMKNRGLTKYNSHIVNVNDGFDFIGFNFRRYKHKDSSTTFICKPSNDSIKACKLELKDMFQKMNGQNVGTLIRKIEPIVRKYAFGWSSVVSKEIYTKLDHYIWIKTMKFLKRLHPQKGVKWIIEQYFKPDKLGKSKNKWILTDPKSYNQLMKMSWVHIIRHAMIQYKSTPFDKNLKSYFEERAKKEFDRYNVMYRQKLAKKQNYICPLCGKLLVGENQSCETHHKVPQCHGGSNEYNNLWLLHTKCHINYHKKFPAKSAIPTEEQIDNYIKEQKGLPKQISDK